MNHLTVHLGNHSATAGRENEDAMNRTRIRNRRAVTLMEVLASIFVISIGLLGVLAVIPFGAFQVSQGRNAEHVSNMLAAAGQDVKIMDLGNVERWVVPTGSPDIDYEIKSDANSITVYRRDDGSSIERLNCERFYMIDPFDTSQSDPFNLNSLNRFFKIGANLDNDHVWREIMTGQDDLIYTVHKNKRTDFGGQNSVVASSGRYTWFMTFAPPNSDNGTNIRSGLIDVANLKKTVTVDLLGCYNRVPGDSTSEREVTIASTGYAQTLNGAQITLQGTLEELDLSKTKYILIVLDNGSSNNDEFPYDGLWCKVVYAPKEFNQGTANQKTIVVSNVNNRLPGSLPTNRKAVIIDGILYHKQVENVRLLRP